jgi:hypothetical protein
MATLGNSTTPSSGYFFDHFGNKQFWTAAAYTMPAGGGIVTDMYVYCAGDSATPTGQLLIWASDNSIAWQSGNITLPSGSESIGGQGWVHETVASVYLPAGTYYFGFWSNGNVVWTFESSGGVNAKGSVSSPASNSGGSDEYGGGGYGCLGAYITYTPGGVAYVNTGTSGSPTWTQGVVYVNTGTAMSPTWTPCSGIFVNTGTAMSPTWTPGG